jgi:hypothetical protein
MDFGFMAGKRQERGNGEVKKEKPAPARSDAGVDLGTKAHSCCGSADAADPHIPARAKPQRMEKWKENETPPSLSTSAS